MPRPANISDGTEPIGADLATVAKILGVTSGPGETGRGSAVDRGRWQDRAIQRRADQARAGPPRHRQAQGPAPALTKPQARMNRPGFIGGLVA